jgi:hypothetical protein
MEYVTPNGSSWVLESGAPTPCYQPPWNTTGFPMAFCITKEDNLSELGRVNTSVPMNPYVKAKVRFKVGPAYTKPYEITVLCNHVYFANNESISASSHSHHRVSMHPCSLIRPPDTMKQPTSFGLSFLKSATLA